MDTTVVNVDSIEPPINVSGVDKAPLLFYLAGNVPLSMEKFASRCANSENHVEEILENRFQNEIRIDHTGFLTLTDAAWSSVYSEAKRVLSEAVEAHKQGKECVNQDNYESAIDHYRIAETLFSEVQSRLSAVRDPPEKLGDRLEVVRETHDKLQKERTKDVLAHRKLIAGQREEEGDNAMQGSDYLEAVEDFKGALEAFEEALDAVEAYNDNRLSSSSPHLDSSILDNRVDQLKRKLNKANKKVKSDSSDDLASQHYDQSDEADSKTARTSTVNKVDDSNTKEDSSATTVDQPSKKDIIEEIGRCRDKLGRMPRLTEVAEGTSWNQHDILAKFDSWDKALESAGIDKRQELVDDLKQSANNVEGKLTTTKKNQYGEFSAGIFYDEFDSWEDALAAADLDQSADKPEEKNTPRNTGASESIGHESKKDLVEANSAQNKETVKPIAGEAQSTESGVGPGDFASFEELPPNERYSDEMAIKIEGKGHAGFKRDAVLQVSDVSGTTLQFNFWSKHDLSPPNSIGEWYVVEEVRLQEWEKDGETNQNLSSTRDTSWHKLDDELADDDSQQNPESKTSEQPDHNAASESNSGTKETNGLLNSIESEFEDDLI